MASVRDYNTDHERRTSSPILHPMGIPGQGDRDAEVIPIRIPKVI
jgi:hypothetical protein